MPKAMLIVDDDSSARLAYRTVFKARGFEVKEARNGKEGLEMLKKDPVDILFLDLSMPVMQGEELMEIMANDEKLKKIPVIVETALGSPGPGRERKAQERFGGRLKLECFTRPGRPEDIMSAVDRLMKLE